MNRRPSSLEARIETLKQAIVRLGDLRPGKLSQQYNVCGKADCRCKADPPKKHGPYYQLSFTRSGKSSTQFVRKEDLAVVRLQLRNYQRLQELIALDHVGDGTVASQTAVSTTGWRFPETSACPTRREASLEGVDFRGRENSKNQSQQGLPSFATETS
jgi:hypothetical protein